MNRLLAASLLSIPCLAAANARADETTPALTAEQAAEVRAIVSEVLADAERRSTLLSGKELAGIDEKGGIFLKSEDSAFQLNLKGRVQFRYLYNEQNDRSNANGGESEDGFQLRRVKLTFAGYVGEPRIKYNLILATDRKSGLTYMEEAWMAKDLDSEGTLEIAAGKMKLPFAREELISSGKQLSVDRALVTEYYTLNRGEAVQMQWWRDQFRWRTALHAGGNSETSNFNVNTADYAVASRFEWLAFGTNKDMETNSALTDLNKQGLLFGLAADYEKAHAGVPAPTAGLPDQYKTFPANVDNVLSLTADATWKTAGWCFSGAWFTSYVDREGAGYGNRDLHTWGVVASADYRISDALDVYVRWEHVDDDATSAASAAAATALERGMQAVTLGANYLVNKNVKLTADLVYIYNSDPVSAINGPLNNGQFSDGLGILGGVNNNNDQLALRLQAQIEF